MPAAGTTRGQLNEHHMPKKYFIFDDHIAAAVAGGWGAVASPLHQGARWSVSQVRGEVAAVGRGGGGGPVAGWGRWWTSSRGPPGPVPGGDGRHGESLGREAESGPLIPCQRCSPPEMLP